MSESPEQRRPGLDTLPTELLLQICIGLKNRSLARLARTGLRQVTAAAEDVLYKGGLSQSEEIRHEVLTWAARHNRPGTVDKIVNIGEWHDVNIMKPYLPGIHLTYRRHTSNIYMDDLRYETGPILSALHVASLFGSTDMVEKLLEHGAVLENRMEHRSYDLGAYRLSPLFCALWAGRVPTARLLLQRGAEMVVGYREDTHGIYQEELSALQCAVAFDLGELIPELLTNRADVNFIGHIGGESALHHASRKGYLTKYIPMLLGGGARPDVTDSQGRSPVHYLARFCEKEWSQSQACNAIRILVSAGVDVDLVDHDLLPPLSMAASKASLKIVQCLLDSGARADHIMFANTDMNECGFDDRPASRNALEWAVEALLLAYSYSSSKQQNTGGCKGALGCIEALQEAGGTLTARTAQKLLRARIDLAFLQPIFGRAKKLPTTDGEGWVALYDQWSQDWYRGFGPGELTFMLEHFPPPTNGMLLDRIEENGWSWSGLCFYLLGREALALEPVLELVTRLVPQIDVERGDYHWRNAICLLLGNLEFDYSRHMHLVRGLLAMGVDLNYQDDQGNCSLMYLLNGLLSTHEQTDGFATVLNLLLEHGLDIPEALEDFGYGWLEELCYAWKKHKRVDVVDELRRTFSWPQCRGLPRRKRMYVLGKLEEVRLAICPTQPLPDMGPDVYRSSELLDPGVEAFWSAFSQARGL